MENEDKIESEQGQLAQNMIACLTLLHPGEGKNLSTDENFRLFKKFLRPYFKS